MHFFKTIPRSIYDPAFYQELVQKPFSFSLKYFYVLALLLSVVSTFLFSLSTLPVVRAFLNDIGPRFLASYPDYLTITIKNGQASSNAIEPYFFTVPTISPGMSQEESSKTNLLVIDTKTSFSLQQFGQYDTFALLTREALAVSTRDSADRGDIRVYPLAKTPDIEITKSLLTLLVQKIQPFIRFVGPLLVIVVFLGFISLQSANLLYLLIFALLVWGIAKIKKLGVGYKKSYQIGIHAITLPLLIYALMTTFNVHAPYLFTLLSLLIVFANIVLPKSSSHDQIPSA